jgi:MoxR-like ATPase
MTNRFDRAAPDLEVIETDAGQDTRLGRNYEATEELEDAVNAALILGRPLFVSGPPGCGKTHLGYAVARKMGVPRVHFFAVKSGSEARDLFYAYDALRRFQEAQLAALGGDVDARGRALKASAYLEFRALGLAILDAHETEDVKHFASASYKHPDKPRRSVVVIDEIDKASRDFANDLLDEIDQLRFRTPELFLETREQGEDPVTKGRAKIADDMRPIVVITSNSEAQLPDPFLRRCVFAQIQFPDDDEAGRARLDRIMLNALNLEAQPTGPIAAVRRMFFAYRARPLTRKPGVAELLDAAKLVSEIAGGDALASEHLRRARPALVKQPEDGRHFDELAFAEFLRG